MNFYEKAMYTSPEEKHTHVKVWKLQQTCKLLKMIQNIGYRFFFIFDGSRSVYEA